MVTQFLRTYGSLYLIALLIAVYATVYAMPGMVPSSYAGALFSLGTALFMAMWVCSDARRRHRTPCFEFGTFIFLTWIVSVPGYLLVTRGWKGLLVVVTVFLLFMSCALFLVVLGATFLTMANQH